MDFAAMSVFDPCGCAQLIALSLPVSDLRRCQGIAHED